MTIPIDQDALLAQQALGVLVLDPQGRITQVNDRASALLWIDREELLGAQWADVAVTEEPGLDLSLLLADPHGHGSLSVTADRSPTSSPLSATIVRLADGSGAVLLLTPPPSVASAERQARLDPLTQLVSRRPLLQLLGQHLADKGDRMAVVALNLDRFAAVNDSLGQHVGDQVLVQLAQRIRSLLSGEDQAARFGGDDFVVLFHDVSTRAQAAALTGRMLDRLNEPIEVEGLTLKLSASAGITLVEGLRMASADEALMHATAALHAAKRNGRARFEFFDDDIAAASSQRLRIETSLRQALDEKQLTVAYQPIRDLEAGQLVGAEALIRWADPRMGTVAPDTFVPIAQDSGLVKPLTDFVLDHAVRDAARWRRLTDTDVHVAVNLTGQDLTRRGLAASIAELLATYALPPRALQLEIVETVLVDADRKVLRNMASLRELGVALGIDDFGTGYSSMSYLKHMPVDFVKIDKSFVTGLGTEREDTAIVRAVIALAKSLELTVIGEGIETPTQMRILRELGCDLGQGYLIGHAVPTEVVAEMFPPSGE